LPAVDAGGASDEQLAKAELRPRAQLKTAPERHEAPCFHVIVLQGIPERADPHAVSPEIREQIHAARNVLFSGSGEDELTWSARTGAR